MNQVRNLADDNRLGQLRPVSSIGGSGGAVVGAASPSAVLAITHHDGLLSKQEFLAHLEREKRRTDRSKAPLSLVTVSSVGLSDGRLLHLRYLAPLLLANKRETDLLGYLADDQLALLLPHTNADGAQAVAEKLRNASGALEVRVSYATYPDTIFSHLTERGTGSDSGIFLVDEVPRWSGRYRFCKRFVDVIGAFSLLTVCLPLMAVVAIAVARTSPGPVIFRQARLGRGGVPFVFYKFRSMYANSDDRIHRDYVADLIDGRSSDVNQGDAANPHYKIKLDPRVTPIGRIIRATSIDELPQLFNVLKGDMSLVGPRPPLPYEAEKYQSWHLRRFLEVRPGLTGLWQVEGRSKTTFDEMVRMDLRYVRAASLWLDFRILFRTIAVVLARDGAG